MRISKPGLIVLVILIPVLLAGCKNDSTRPAPAPLDVAETPAELMADFQTAYATMDSAAYLATLDPAFTMILQPSTTASFPELGDALDVTEEAHIAGNMFGGRSGHDADGNLTNPISSISLRAPDQLTAWTPAEEDDPLPGVTSALFNVAMDFFRAGDKTLKVKGTIKFYITERDTVFQGNSTHYYRFVGMWDLTSPYKSDESATFGGVKALFR